MANACLKKFMCLKKLLFFHKEIELKIVMC